MRNPSSRCAQCGKRLTPDQAHVVVRTFGVGPTGSWGQPTKSEALVVCHACRDQRAATARTFWIAGAILAAGLLGAALLAAAAGAEGVGFLNG